MMVEKGFSLHLLHLKFSFPAQNMLEVILKVFFVSYSQNREKFRDRELLLLLLQCCFTQIQVNKLWAFYQLTVLILTGDVRLCFCAQCKPESELHCEGHLCIVSTSVPKYWCCEPWMYYESWIQQSESALLLIYHGGPLQYCNKTSAARQAFYS